MWGGIMVIDAKTSYPTSYYRVNENEIYIVEHIYRSDTYYRDPDYTTPVLIASLIGPEGRKHECDINQLEVIA